MTLGSVHLHKKRSMGFLRNTVRDKALTMSKKLYSIFPLAIYDPVIFEGIDIPPALTAASVPLGRAGQARLRSTARGE